MNKPVVFDLDDYPTNYSKCMVLLDKLKLKYPNFKCTLFTIPSALNADSWIMVNKRRDWLEIAVHGFLHEKEEFKNFKPETVERILNTIVDERYIKVYKQPYWLWNDSILTALRNINYAVAVQRQFEIPNNMIGYSLDDNRIESWHGHTHNTCGNGIEESFEILWNKWNENEEFRFVSEVIR